MFITSLRVRARFNDDGRFQNQTRKIHKLILNTANIFHVTKKEESGISPKKMTREKHQRIHQAFPNNVFNNFLVFP
jgi:hypothetical protein